jgi:hypothetical protein
MFIEEILAGCQEGDDWHRHKSRIIVSPFYRTPLRLRDIPNGKFWGKSATGR